MIKRHLRILSGVTAISALLAAVPVFADSFDEIKKRLATDGCQHFEFISIVESDVFEQVDSTFGSAYLSADGRYNIKIADEQYLRDSEHAYSYSESNNQVVIEKADSPSSLDDEIAFLSRLDSLYVTHVLKPDNKYRLIRKTQDATGYPDSMVVVVDGKKNELKQISYLDVNEDRNTIIFLKQVYYDSCDSRQFEADFPESVEKVRLED